MVGTPPPVQLEGELIFLLAGELLHHLNWVLQAHLGQLLLDLLQEGGNPMMFWHELASRTLIGPEIIVNAKCPHS